MLKIEVTDAETGAVSEYVYSRDNWANRWACMAGDVVVMWAPDGLVIGGTIRTSGRLWRVFKPV